MTISRREFLGQVGTGFVAPLLLGVTDKAGSKKPVLGSGEHTYEVTHDWGELPADIQYGNTHGVCEDSQGHIYIHHTVYSTSDKPDSMVIFDGDGKFVKSWGKDFRGGAHGLHIRKESGTEYLYLCDIQRGLVVKTTLTGEEAFSLGYPKESEPYSKPGPRRKTAEVEPDKSSCSAERRYLRRRWLRFKLHCPVRQPGKVQAHVRRTGDGSRPIAVSARNYFGLTRRLPILNVADRSNKRIQRFSLDGKPIDSLYGTNAPCHFNIYKNGDMVVPDLFARVTLMDRENRIIEHLGDDSSSDYMATRKLSRDHFIPGKFVCPHGACFDHEGNIYVVEWVEVGRVSKLRHIV